MTRKITKSNQSEQRSDRGAKRSDHGGAYSGAPALHPYAIWTKLYCHHRILHWRVNVMPTQADKRLSKYIV